MNHRVGSPTDLWGAIVSAEAACKQTTLRKCLDLAVFRDGGSNLVAAATRISFYVPLAHHGLSARRLACASTLEWSMGIAEQQACKRTTELTTSLREFTASLMRSLRLNGFTHQACTRFCAASRPNSISSSVASAACSQIVGTSGRSVAVKFSSTNAAGSLRPGGRPIPIRTR
jgi:hypothetical protein